MKPSELRQKETEELVAMANDLRRDLFKLRMQHYTGQLDRVAKLKVTRREIARVETILSQRKAATQQGA